MTANELEAAAEVESAAAELEVERMDPALTHAIGEAWKNLPGVTKEWIQAQVRMALADLLRGRPQDTVHRVAAALLPRLMASALVLARDAKSSGQLRGAIRQLVRSTPIPPALIERRIGMTTEQIRQYEQRRRARRGVPGRRQAKGGRRWRESELEFTRDLEAAAELVEQESGEAFYTRVQPVPGLPGYEEGHEVLTRAAASGLVAGADLSALLLGVIRPDRGGASYWSFPGAALHAFSPDAQRAHSLRRQKSTPQGAALAEIRGHLTALYAQALRAGDRSTALAWAGEALHLIQDAYSSAHVERSLGVGPGGSSPIRRIRAFYATAWPPSRSTSPDEHGTPSDSRDSILAAGRLREEAKHAITASQDYLAMMLRHLASPAAPGNAAELRQFLDRHLSF